MTIDDIIQGISRIWSRLFDHRGFSNGEINFVLNEFEQKRGEDEVDTLFVIIETIADIRDTQIDRVKQSVNETVPDLHKNLHLALESYNALVNSENKPDKDGVLEKNREIRKANHNKFVEEIGKKYSEVDSAFDAKVENLKEHYLELEQQLKKVSY